VQSIAFKGGCDAFTGRDWRKTKNHSDHRFVIWEDASDEWPSKLFVK